MARAAVIALAFALAACGRIGFDEVGALRPEAGAGAPGDGGADAEVVTGDGSVAGCEFVSCPSTEVACCDGSETSCVPQAACTGVEFQCESSADCNGGQRCCVVQSLPGGSFCSAGICPG